MVKSLMSAIPRHAGHAGARRAGGARAIPAWSIALALLAAGCGGSSPPPADPDAGPGGPDAGELPDGGVPPDAFDPFRPDAGPPLGFDFPDELRASNGAALDWFGYSVAADDDVIVIGAPFHDVIEGGEVVDAAVGTAYVFERIGDAWQQTAQLFSSASNRTSSMFGWSVAVDGNVIAVGAWNEDGPGDQVGVAYVFERVGGTWTQNAKLEPLSGDDQERFGHSVAVSGSRVAVGAPFISDIDDNEEATPAYVFERSGASWVGTRIEPADDPRDSWFGFSVALSGDVLVVGAPGHGRVVQGVELAGFGAAYVFENDGSGWGQTAKLEDIGDTELTGGATQDFMGRGVSVDGDVIVVGSEAGGNPSSLNTGVALVYERPEGAWVESARLVPADAAVGGQVGFAVAVRGSTIVVGAHHDDQFGTDSGAAYVYEKDAAAGWIEKSKLYDPGGSSGDHFGASVALAGTRIVVGSRYDDKDGYDSGSTYVFTEAP